MICNYLNTFVCDFTLCSTYEHRSVNLHFTCLPEPCCIILGCFELLMKVMWIILGTREDKDAGFIGDIGIG